LLSELRELTRIFRQGGAAAKPSRFLDVIPDRHPLGLRPTHDVFLHGFVAISGPDMDMGVRPESALVASLSFAEPGWPLKAGCAAAQPHLLRLDLIRGERKSSALKFFEDENEHEDDLGLRQHFTRSALCRLRPFSPKMANK